MLEKSCFPSLSFWPDRLDCLKKHAIFSSLVQYMYSYNHTRSIFPIAPFPIAVVTNKLRINNNNNNNNSPFKEMHHPPQRKSKNLFLHRITLRNCSIRRRNLETGSRTTSRTRRLADGATSISTKANL